MTGESPYRNSPPSPHKHTSMHRYVWASEVSDEDTGMSPDMRMHMNMGVGMGAWAWQWGTDTLT